MPTVSPAQKRLMQAAEHTPGGYGGVPQAVGKEFIDADKRKAAEDAAIRAAGTMFVSPKGTVLWVKPPAGEYPGEWSFPGGKIEPGEDAAQAARREAGEELGYVPDGEALQFHQGLTERGVDYTTFIHPVEGEFQVSLSPENHAWCWAPLDDPPLPCHPSITAMMGQVRYAADGGVAQDESVRSYGKDGHLHVATTPISKANVCEYYGREIPGAADLGLDPDRKYKLLRDPDELKKAAATFNNLPLLSKHVPVTSKDHPKELTIGSTGSEAKYEHPYLMNSLVVWTQGDIDKIESAEKRELSSSYHYRADMTPGSHEGEKYDGRMVDIIGNHVAAVTEGRAGPDVVVGDESLDALAWTAIEAALLEAA